MEDDLKQGLTLIRKAVDESLCKIENGVNEVTIDGPIALSLIINVATSRGWTEDPDMDWDWTNGWEVDYFYYMLTPNNKRVGIYGSLLDSNHIELFNA